MTSELSCVNLSSAPCSTMSHFCAPVRSLVQQQPHRIISICGDKQFTGLQLSQRVAAFSNYLRTNYGVRPGDRVALLAYNTDLFFQALLAIIDCGAVATLLNWRWSALELAAAITQCMPSAVVLDGSFLPNISDILSQCSSISHCILLDNSCRVGAFGASAVTWSIAETGFTSTTTSELQLKQPPEQIAIICFTSGSTGTPKAVTLSHAAFLSQSLIKLATVGYNCNDCYVHLAPLFHIGGISSAHAALVAGACHRFLPKYTVQGAVQAIRSSTAFIAVPAILQDIVAAVDSDITLGEYSFSQVERILVGGGSMQKCLQETIQRLFPAAMVLTAYGMSEACSSLTFDLVSSPRPHAGTWLEGMVLRRTHSSRSQEPEKAHLCKQYPSASCAGWPAPGVLISLANEQGSAVGEVLTKGTHVMQGYWGAPEVTRQVLSPDGWLRTGDLGFLDPSGCLWLVGRKKDMIKSGGENVFAAEVEAAIGSHPAVSAVAVVGLPDQRLGEKVGCLVVLDRGWRWVPTEGSGAELANLDAQSQGQGLADVNRPAMISVQDLVRHCREKGLSGYKVPRVMDAQYHDLPRTSLGKVEKRKVMELLEQAEALQLWAGTRSRL